MASSIQLLRSTIAQERPFPGNLLEGQPAVNLNASEPGLFFKAADGSLLKVGPVAITSDGSPPNSNSTGSSGNSVGELWFDASTEQGVLKIYDGLEWKIAGGGGGGGGGAASLNRWTYSAVGGETSLSGTSEGTVLTYTPSLEQVYINGVLLTRGIDYSAINGSSITNLSPLSAGDVIVILSINPAEIIEIPGQVSLLRWTILATAGQTVLQGSDSNSQFLQYSPGFEEVFVNGAFLRRSIDYIASDGATISLIAPLSLDDEVTVLAWSKFDVADIQVSTDDIVDGAVNDAKVSNTAGISSSKLSYLTPKDISRTVESKLSDFLSAQDFGAAQSTVSALSGAYGEPGTIVFISGYHTEFDDGGGFFMWDPAIPAVSHNGGTIIDPRKQFPTDWDDETQRVSWFTPNPSFSTRGAWRRLKDGTGVNVLWFGAKGDYSFGTGLGTDDSEAINKAISVDSNVILARRTYMVTKSLRMAFKFGGATLSGDGSKVSGSRVPPLLVGNTGEYPVIDIIGSQRVKIIGLAVVNGSSNPSKCGIAMRRATASQYSQFCIIEKVDIDLQSDPSAYGGRGTVALYNVAAEIWTIRDVYFLADTGCTFISSDSYGVPSLYATPGGPVSTSTFTIEGASTLHSYNPVGTPLLLSNASFVTGSVYVNGVGGEGSHGFRFLGGCQALDIRIFTEGLQRFGRIDNGLGSSRISCYGGLSPNRYIDTDGGFVSVSNTEFNFFSSFLGGGSGSPDYWISGNSTDLYLNVTVNAASPPAIDFIVPSNETFNRKNCSFTGAERSSITKQSLFTRSSSYDQRPLKLGSYYLWVDSSGRLRIKSGVPSSDTDGTIVGTQS